MPVPSSMSSRNNEKVIKIQRENNMSLQPSSPSPFPSTNSQQQQAQQETRSWSTSSYSTKKIVQSSESPEPVVTEQHSSTSTKSSDLFSDKHNNGGTTGIDNIRRGSNSSTTSNNSNLNKTSQMKSSSLVSKALQEFEDDIQNMSTQKNQSFNQTNSSSRRNSSNTSKTMMTIPTSTPTMEIVPSGGGNMMSPWSMGTDAQGDVPLTYEIVTRADGKKEFQLLVTTRDFSPEDLQVKLTDNTLTISGTHEERSATGAYSSKSFYRTCTIPSGVTHADLNCSLDSCCRLKITAIVPDVDNSKHTSTKMVTTKQHQSTKKNSNWHEDGNVPSGFKISPGAPEQVMTVFNNDNNMMMENLGNGMGGLNVDNNGMSSTTKKSVTSTTKTVRMMSSR